MVFAPSEVNLGIMRHFWERGFLTRQIALQVNCSLSTAQIWVNRFNEQLNGGPEVIDRRWNNMGLPKLTNRDLDEVIELLRQDPFQAMKHIPHNLRMDITDQTLRHHLKERRQIKYCKAAKKAELLQQNQDVRLNYANQYINHDEDFWYNVVYIDEKVFSTSKDGNLIFYNHIFKLYNDFFISLNCNAMY